jgi:phosphoglycolate phosphatase
MTPVRLAWLFDVDGTLLMTEGAARQAFGRAVRDRIGAEDDLRDVPFSGRIEPVILGDILRKHGRVFDTEDEARFWDSVFAHMRDLLPPGRGRMMPGIPGLLDRLEREPGWVLGLLTGNMTQMARIKLGHFGLFGRFRFGGFGEMGASRDALARSLVRRVGREYGVPPGRCVVVGDTEHDVDCARAAGARVIAVATGTSSRAELEACRPDLLLDDLGDAEAVAAWARGVAGEA